MTKLYLPFNGGRLLTLEEMTVDDLDINAMCHSLSQICRFSGNTSRFYSVAEHSILCYRLAEILGFDDDTCKACAVHDLHEAIIGDIVGPVLNTALSCGCGQLKDMIVHLEDLIMKKFNLPTGMNAIEIANNVSIVDNLLLRVEFDALFDNVFSKRFVPSDMLALHWRSSPYEEQLEIIHDYITWQDDYLAIPENMKGELQRLLRALLAKNDEGI